jgi:hypothetical protein
LSCSIGRRAVPGRDFTDRDFTDQDLIEFDVIDRDLTKLIESGAIRDCPIDWPTRAAMIDLIK